MFDSNEVVFFINVYNHCPDNENIGYILNEMQLGDLKMFTNQYHLIKQKHEENYKFISTIKYFLAI